MTYTFANTEAEGSSPFTSDLSAHLHLHKGHVRALKVGFPNR